MESIIQPSAAQREVVQSRPERRKMVNKKAAWWKAKSREALNGQDVSCCHTFDSSTTATHDASSKRPHTVRMKTVGFSEGRLVLIGPAGLKRAGGVSVPAIFGAG